MPTVSRFHKYTDEIKLLVADFTAVLALTADTLASATVTRTGAAVVTLGTIVVGTQTVGVPVSGGTPATIPPPNVEDDAADVLEVIAVTTAGQTLQTNITIVMRQAGASRTAYAKYPAEARDYTWDFTPAVGPPYNDPLGTTPSAPVVAQVSGPDSVLTFGTPALVTVGALPLAGVRCRLGVGTVAGVYVVRALVYTTHGQRLQTNLTLTIKAATDP